MTGSATSPSRCTGGDTVRNDLLRTACPSGLSAIAGALVSGYDGRYTHVSDEQRRTAIHAPARPLSVPDSDPGRHDAIRQLMLAGIAVSGDVRICPRDGGARNSQLANLASRRSQNDRNVACSQPRATMRAPASGDPGSARPGPDTCTVVPPAAAMI